MTVQTISTQAGETLVVLSADEYEDLVDMKSLDAAMEAIRKDKIETLGEAEADAYLAAASPLMFWREHRGLSRKALAEATSLPEHELARLESGDAAGDVRAYARLAEKLRVRIEDIVPE